MTILLVRHAAHADLGLRLTGRAPGVGLTAEGRAQAATLARALAAEGLEDVRTSPRTRARQTAEALAAAAGAPLQVEPALDEIDFGDWTGAEFAALDGRPDWTEWNARRGTTRPPGGEGMAQAAGRIAGLVARLGADRPEARIALVTHSDMIRGLVATVLGLPLDNLLRFEIGPASVSRIAAGPGGMRVLSLNESPGRAPP